MNRLRRLTIAAPEDGVLRYPFSVPAVREASALADVAACIDPAGVTGSDDLVGGISDR